MVRYVCRQEQATVSDKLELYIRRNEPNIYYLLSSSNL